MIRESTMDWLNRLTTSEFQTGAADHARELLGAMSPRQVAERAREIIAALDDGVRDDATLATIEAELTDPDDLRGQVKALVRLRDQFIEALEDREVEEGRPDPWSDGDLLAYFHASLDFRATVRSMLIGTGVLAETDQSTDMASLLRLFLPSPKATT